MTKPWLWRAEGEDAIETIRALARLWVQSEELARVLTVFGAEDIERTPDALVAWAAATLDTRQGAERQVAAPVRWPEQTVNVLLEAADGVGLGGVTATSRRSYDHTIVMGGTTTANRLRTELAAELALSGVDLGALTGLGSERQLRVDEQLDHEDASAETEWEDLAAVIGHAFGAESAQILHAPSDDQGRRANSGEALAFFAATVPGELGDILLVTSGIYVPYTFFVAASNLVGARPASFEVIGTATSREGPRDLLAQRFAQEINSTLRAIAALD